jgi:hypothetical protein
MPYAAFSEQLDARLQSLYQPRIPQGPDIHNAVLLEALEITYVYDSVSLLEDVGEAPLGKPPRQRHLATLKSGRQAASGPGIGAFAAAAGCLAAP